jgi:RNA polymerase sigma-70 factor (ECF subfamily)
VFVWQTLRALGVPDAALDDAAQDVFVVVYRRLREFEGRAKLRTWLFEIARRVAARHRTRAHREAARHSEMPELRGPDDLESAMDRTLAVETLRAFTRSLDDDRLRVFMLAEFGELRGREIAEALDLNINTVYARLRSAHKDLDRWTTRLRAREANALMAAARRERPSRAAQRRTWAMLVVELGLPPAVTAATTTGGSIAASKWIGLLVAAGVASVVAIGGLTAKDAGTRPHSRIAVAAATEPVSPPVANGPTPVAASRVAPHEATETETETETQVPTRARRSARRGAAPPVASTEPVATTATLAQEVAAVQELRRTITQDAAFDDAMRRYQRDHAQGVLLPEVSALAIEHECRRGADDADAAIAEFAKRWPRSSLVARLRSTCGVSIRPQKTQGRGTQGS